MFWCWLQEWICSCADVVPSPDTADNRTADGFVAEHIPEPIAVYRTVIALHEFALHNYANSVTRKDDINNASTTATNTKTADCVDNEDDNHYSYMQMSYTTDASTHALAITNRNNNNNNSINSNDGSGGGGGHWSTNGNIITAVTAGTIRKAPRSLDLNSKIKKRKMSNSKRTFAGGLPNDQLNEILEECEYDSESGKFNCIATTSTESSVDFNDGVESSPLNAVAINGNNNSNGNTMGTTFSGSMGQIRKRIEFFENNCDESNDELLFVTQQKKSEKSNGPRVETEDTNKQTSTICCLLMFLCTALFLYLFPVEN